ncbi:MAG: bifunctional DNA primase/polymerase [Spirochaetaceae bacterium]|jgi:hypothetical protein|nr:bifunctional DNA primase/polymerase [Spirochaetaceae bacterium]
METQLLTEVQREALTEKAAAMHYKSGLDWKAATLAAFDLYFPGDFRAMKETAAAYPDGETVLYEYLSGLLLKPPETALEGSRTNKESKKVTYSNAPEGPPMARYEGLQALSYLTAHGIPIKDFYKPGADADVKTYSVATPLVQGKRYKAYIRGSFLCLDLDRGHKDGGDGVANLYRQLESMGKPHALLPAYLKDIDRGTFPFYTKTPSGGYHLFFKYPGPYITGTLAPDVEILTLRVSAGWKDGKPYILHGNLDTAPHVPAFIIDAIKPPQARTPKYRPYTPEKKEWSRPSWALITEWTDRDRRAGAGRNNRAYSLALHAASHDWPQAETLAALQSDLSIDGLPQAEIQTAVNSAYKRKRT